jgi:hypothetical protein
VLQIHILHLLGGNVVLIIWNPAVGLIVLKSVIVILWVRVPACVDSHNVIGHNYPTIMVTVVKKLALLME